MISDANQMYTDVDYIAAIKANYPLRRTIHVEVKEQTRLELRESSTALQSGSASVVISTINLEKLRTRRKEIK